MDAIDTDIAEPAREIDKPLLMSVEDVFSITGRGTVATGRIERGVVKVGEEIEIVGLGETMKTTVTGVEMFRKQLDQGMAGDNVGIFFVVLIVNPSFVVTLLRNQVRLHRTQLPRLSCMHFLRMKVVVTHLSSMAIVHSSSSELQTLLVSSSAQRVLKW